MATMLKLGILPEGYIYPKVERAQRDLLRNRFQLVQQKTLHLLSIQGLYSRHINVSLNNNKLKQLANDQLVRDFEDDNVRLAVASNMVNAACLAKQITMIEKVLKNQLKLKEEFIELTSIDGIGLTLALTIMLETGDIARFDKVGQDTVMVKRKAILMPRMVISISPEPLSKRLISRFDLMVRSKNITSGSWQK